MTDKTKAEFYISAYTPVQVQLTEQNTDARVTFDFEKGRMKAIINFPEEPEHYEIVENHVQLHLYFLPKSQQVVVVLLEKIKEKEDPTMQIWGFDSIPTAFNQLGATPYLIPDPAVRKAFKKLMKLFRQIAKRIGLI